MSRILVWTIIILLFSVLCGVECVNILGIFDSPSKSLHILGHSLLASLAKRGFNVTMLSAYPEEAVTPNYTHIQIKGLLQYKEECYKDLIQGKLRFGMFSTLGFQKRSMQIALESKEIENLKNSHGKFDLIIQTYALNEAYLGLAHTFAAPVIAFVPFGGYPHINDLTANPAPYSYVPIPISKYTDDMTFFQRVGNTIMCLLVTSLHQFYYLPQQVELSAKYFPEAPPLKQLLADKIDVVFVNSHISTETPRPYMPTVIQIGGYHVEESETLSPEYRDYLDSAQDGVVLFSFGTHINTSNLINEKLDVFKSALEKASFRVLWKCEHSSYDTENIAMSKWLPQRSILSHPRILAFITHGGLGSTIEALYHGVPLICISFFGDQFKNCEEAAIHNYGIHLPFSKLNEASFSKSLDDIINNPKYRENAKFRSALFQDQPMKPIDKAVFWIKHVIKYKGAKHFKSKAVSMPLYQYLLLDVLGFILVIMAILVFISYLLIKMIYKNIFKVSNIIPLRWLINTFICTLLIIYCRMMNIIIH